ncbi:hypothetical protein TSUD_75160 [Trifolium subterraneum]|nr:hypothetical protein TSUD_75160 [Trifolium subterraneum]
MMSGGEAWNMDRITFGKDIEGLHYGTKAESIRTCGTKNWIVTHVRMKLVSTRPVLTILVCYPFLFIHAASSSLLLSALEIRVSDP